MINFGFVNILPQCVETSKYHAQKTLLYFCGSLIKHSVVTPMLV